MPLYEAPSTAKFDMKPVTGKTLVKLSSLGKNVDSSSALFGDFFGAIFDKVVEPGPYDLEVGATFVDYKRMLRGDLFSSFLFAASITKGSDYRFDVPCGECRKTIKWKIDLQKHLKQKVLPAESLERFRQNLPFDADADGVPVKFRLQMPHQEEWLVRWLREHNRKTASLTDRLFSQVVTFGDIAPNDHKKRWEAFSDLPIRTLQSLAKQFEAADCGTETAIDIKCTHPDCEKVQRVAVPLDVNRLFGTSDTPDSEDSSTDSSESMYDPNGTPDAGHTSSTDPAIWAPST